MEDSRLLSAVSRPENDDGTKTVEELVGEIVPRVTLRLLALMTVVTLLGYVSYLTTYITVFTGYIPYTSWICTSEHCEDILKNNLYTRLTLCNADYNLTHGTDFEWNTDGRTSFALDLGFYCGEEYKVSTISSMFFGGALFGLLVSSAVFDRFGRKVGTIVFGVIGAVATFSGMACNSYWSLIVMRFIQGFGRLVSMDGLYCWLLEFAPGNLRNLFNSLLFVPVSISFLGLSLISYICKDWHQIFLVASIMSFVAMVPLFFVPESPRFLLVTGKEEKAKEVLKRYSRILGNPINFDQVKLVYNSVEEKQSFWGQLKSFIHYPYMTKQVLLLIISWNIIGLLFFGFGFSWSRLTSDIYLTYVYVGVVGTVSNVCVIPITDYLGRKRSMMFFLIAAGASFCTATVNFQIYGSWSVEQVSSLLGYMFINSAYIAMYLYTAEIAPTSHRGTIISLCSCASNIGSYIGPYSLQLFDIVGTRMTMYLFAGGTICALVVISMTSDPTNKPIPETPEDVTRD